MSGGIFDCHNLEEAIGISWVEARAAAKHPTLHKTEENVRGAEVGTPWAGVATLLVSLEFAGEVVASTRSCEGQVGVGSEPVCSCNAPVWGMFLLFMAF